MSLRTTRVAQCLDKKLLLFGYEIPDVLAIFLTLSILNFIFGSTSLKFFFVWVPTIALALILKYGKKGKAEGYLVHWLRFQIKPGTYRAFPEASNWKKPPQLN